MRLEKRIRALEVKMITDPVTLFFADGSTREICGRGDSLLHLFTGLGGEADLSPAQAEQLDLIRRSVRVQEPSGHLVQLLRCLDMPAGAEEPDSDARPPR